MIEMFQLLFKFHLTKNPEIANKLILKLLAYLHRSQIISLIENLETLYGDKE
jgi:hypothetical protein